MGTKRVMRSGKKIAPPVSNKFNFIQETLVRSNGLKTKVWTLPPAEMYAALNDSDTDSDGSEDFELYPTNFGVGVNPHESGLPNSSDREQEISVGRPNLGFTRRCKLNYLRKRRMRQRLEQHKLIKKPAFNFTQDTLVSASGVKTKVWTLPPAEMYSALNDSDTDSAGSEDFELYPTNFGIGTRRSNPPTPEAAAHPPKEQTSSFASCIEEITKHVELLKQELAKSHPSTQCLEWADLLFSWITKIGALPHYTQKSGECWAAALSLGHAYYMAANKIDGERVTMELLLDGVSKEHLMGSGGIDRLESARDFMVDNNYVKDMIVHRRPSHPDGFAGYEILLEKLLARGPMVVVFDTLPGYKDYDGKSIYIPDETEVQVAVLETYKQHSVVVTGCGVGLVEEKAIEFWQTHDTQKSTWGVNGFGQLARRNGLIVAAVEFKF